MTDQEAFDKMVAHLRNLPSRNTDGYSGRCMYNGSKCAVGALMTDEEQKLFGGVVSDVNGLLIIMTRSSHSSQLHELSSDMLRDMQHLHDGESSWSDTGFRAEFRLEKVAKKHSLIYTPPSQPTSKVTP